MTNTRTDQELKELDRITREITIHASFHELVKMNDNIMTQASHSQLEVARKLALAFYAEKKRLKALQTTTVEAGVTLYVYELASTNPTAINYVSSVYRDGDHLVFATKSESDDMRIAFRGLDRVVRQRGFDVLGEINLDVFKTVDELNPAQAGFDAVKSDDKARDRRQTIITVPLPDGTFVEHTLSQLGDLLYSLLPELVCVRCNGEGHIWKLPEMTRVACPQCAETAPQKIQEIVLESDIKIEFKDHKDVLLVDVKRIYRTTMRDGDELIVFVDEVNDEYDYRYDEITEVTDTHTKEIILIDVLATQKVS